MSFWRGRKTITITIKKAKEIIDEQTEYQQMHPGHKYVKRKKDNDDKDTHMSYCIRNSLIKKMNLMAAHTKMKKSDIVNEALSQYFAKEYQKIVKDN